LSLPRFIPNPIHVHCRCRPIWRLSDELVGELLDHDLLVISTPMHNFSVPSGSKAWIDQIVRLGLTFNHTLDNGLARYEPLVHGKKALDRHQSRRLRLWSGRRVGSHESCRSITAHGAGFHRHHRRHRGRG
jgi:hypothetical protein